MLLQFRLFGDCIIFNLIPLITLSLCSASRNCLPHSFIDLLWLLLSKVIVYISLTLEEGSGSGIFAWCQHTNTKVPHSSIDLLWLMLSKVTVYISLTLEEWSGSRIFAWCRHTNRNDELRRNDWLACLIGTSYRLLFAPISMVIIVLYRPLWF